MYFAKITNLFEQSIIYYIDEPQHVAGHVAYTNYSLNVCLQ